MDYHGEIKKITKRAFEELQVAPFLPRTHEARLSSRGNIYAIFVDEELKYIGERKSKDIKQRLNNHLFGSGYRTDNYGKQIGTVSKWHKVLEAFGRNQNVTYKCILIEPDTLRTAIEEELIRLHGIPDWNIHS